MKYTQKYPIAFESFDNNMSSTEACFYQGGNERNTGSMAFDVNYMAKCSSQINSSSLTISSPIFRQKNSVTKDVQQSGMSFRPRVVQDT